jgi:hypothetical protein
MAASSDQFDATYYARHYDHAKVHDQQRLDSLVNGIMGFAAWWKVPVRSVLDVGAGTGGIGRALQAHHPTVRYRGTEFSKHACAEYGHQYVDISVWAPRRAYDLTVCLSVLQYLDDNQCEAAISNLATATRSLLYLEVTTSWDRKHTVDTEHTDMDVHWRSGAWYRRSLTRHFRQVGGGLWARHDAPVVFFDLEAARPRSDRSDQ